MNTSNLTRWLVTCVLLLLIGVIAGYQFAPSETPPRQYVPVVAPLPTLTDAANQYLITHYGSLDRNSRQVITYVLNDCAGVRCEEWGIRLNPETLSIYLRCYLSSQVCVPTHEEFMVQPNLGNYPTVTPYGNPEP